jgi:protein-tyrosine phosphatase
MDQLDGHEWHVQKLYSAVEWIRRVLLGGGTVLVHCHAGISRSPILVAIYLYTCGFDFDRALDRIKGQRPIVQPAPAVMISAKRAFGNSPLAPQTTGK